MSIPIPVAGGGPETCGVMPPIYGVPIGMLNVSSGSMWQHVQQGHLADQFKRLWRLPMQQQTFLTHHGVYLVVVHKITLLVTCTERFTFGFY